MNEALNETRCEVEDTNDRTPLTVALTHGKDAACIQSVMGGFNFCIFLDTDSAREVAATLLAIADVLEAS